MLVFKRTQRAYIILRAPRSLNDDPHGAVDYHDSGWTIRNVSAPAGSELEMVREYSQECRKAAQNWIFQDRLSFALRIHRAIRSGHVVDGEFMTMASQPLIRP